MWLNHSSILYFFFVLPHNHALFWLNRSLVLFVIIIFFPLSTLVSIDIYDRSLIFAMLFLLDFIVLLSISGFLVVWSFLGGMAS